MAEYRAARHRLFIEDARRNGVYLRTTWHADAQTFVVSTWQDEVCTGAVRVPREGAAQLIALLADGLAESASAPAPTAPAGRATTVVERVRAWLRAGHRKTA